MAPDTFCAGVSRRRLLGIGAALALTAGPVLGEEGATTDDRFAALEADLANAVQRGFAPGLVGMVAQGDEVRVIPVGRMAEDGPPMQRDSIFRIASMTKPITAAAVMMLVDEGRLRLDEPVDRLLPELADRRVLRRIDGPVEDTVPARRPITVEDLLTFRLGWGLILAAPGTLPIQQAIADLGIVGFGPPDRRCPTTPTNGCAASPPCRSSRSLARPGCTRPARTSRACSSRVPLASPSAPFCRNGSSRRSA